MNRREFLQTTATAATELVLPSQAVSQDAKYATRKIEQLMLNGSGWRNIRWPDQRAGWIVRCLAEHSAWICLGTPAHDGLCLVQAVPLSIHERWSESFWSGL